MRNNWDSFHTCFKIVVCAKIHYHWLYRNETHEGPWLEEKQIMSICSRSFRKYSKLWPSYTRCYLFLSLNHFFNKSSHFTSLFECLYLGISWIDLFKSLLRVNFFKNIVNLKIKSFLLLIQVFYHVHILLHRGSFEVIA